MKSRSLTIAALLAATLAPATLWAGYVSRSEVKLQNENFKNWWEDDLEWRFDELPLKGKVPQYRMPYAGYIYPDKQGGCESALRKYDYAFNWGRGSAARFEKHDIAIHKDKVEKPGGLFGWRMVTRTDTPDWAGHCNGWVSAAIRHAEPRKSVVRNGVTFTPADIKALLAELYVYNDTLSLGGEHEPAVNPATLHVILTNWIGRGEHPVGMDSATGKEVWNFPIYGYNAAAAKKGNRRVEVRLNLGYVYMLNQEFHVAPKNNKFLALHYMLYLDEAGRIIGGDYLSDSERVDMLWAPRHLFATGRDGNKAGNPYVNTESVLALWRASAPEELRSKWWNIDPTEDDRIILDDEVEVDVESIIADEDATTEEVVEEIVEEATAEATELNVDSDEEAAAGDDETDSLDLETPRDEDGVARSSRRNWRR